MLWNRNYLLRFRFRFWLLKSYGSGSGSNFWKVMVPVPVPTFEKVTVPVPAPYLDRKKQIKKKNFGNFFDFLLSKLFYKEKVHEFQQLYGKMWMKKMFNEGNQIHNFMSSSGSGTVINYGSGSDFLTSYGSGYGSGSTSQKVTVPTVPVPQHWSWLQCFGSRFIHFGSGSEYGSMRIQIHSIRIQIWIQIQALCGIQQWLDPYPDLRWFRWFNKKTGFVDPHWFQCSSGSRELN